MSWNPSPEVAVARDAAQRLNNAKMCIVLYFTDNNELGMATYGRTKALCSEAKEFGDKAYDAVMEDTRTKGGCSSETQTNRPT